MESFVSVLGAINQRNVALFDIWSIIHLLTAVLLVMVIRRPLLALAITVLWEPFELFILSPWLKQEFDVLFGFEGATNSLSDIVFDAVGIACGWLALRLLMSQHKLRSGHRFKVK